MLRPANRSGFVKRDYSALIGRRSAARASRSRPTMADETDEADEADEADETDDGN